MNVIKWKIKIFGSWFSKTKTGNRKLKYINISLGAYNMKNFKFFQAHVFKINYLFIAQKHGTPQKAIKFCINLFKIFVLLLYQSLRKIWKNTDFH